MGLFSNDVPTPKDAPAPSYQSTVDENQKLVKKKELSLARAIQTQQTLGANQLKAGGAGLRLY